MKSLKISSLLLGLLILSSCGKKPFFMDTITFEGQKWKEEFTPVFKVDFDGDTSAYDVVFTFRTSTNYEYNNLWIYLSTKGPECEALGNKNNFLGRNAKELKIAKASGDWLGNKSGTFVENKLYYIRSKFCKGTYEFKLEQGVTMNELNEVHDVTIEINPTVWEK
ncbi:MAG: hypothetical protein QNL43_07040 [Crocinitomicaceae bacterium]|jgi:gliding motility-associated lipoprotein GldH|tara:strand:+ start:26195 stop:26689 length:495 start_codon:yes stop_codon:yes gene_type:complete